jgi:hypothetical protein
MGRFTRLPDLPVLVTQDDRGLVTKAEVDPAAVNTLKTILTQQITQAEVSGALHPGHLRHVKLENRVVNKTETLIGHGLEKTPHWYFVIVKTSENRPKVTNLLAKEVTASETTIAHGLSAAPDNYWIKVIDGGAGGGYVWESTAPNGTNIFLTASGTVDVDIGLIEQIDTPASIKETRRADDTFLYLSSDMVATVDILVEA